MLPSENQTRCSTIKTGRGTDAGDTVTPFIDPNQAHFFPLGTPNLFKTFFAPADYIETVNTLGLPRYAKAIPSDNNKSVRLEMQTNPLSLCLRPRRN
jgi:Phage major capsid protein E